MPDPMRRTLLITLAAVLAGCPAVKNVTGPGANDRAKANTRVAATPVTGPTRSISGDNLVRLRGEVRLLSERGTGIVSNNGGTIVGDAGASLIGKIRSPEGATLIGKIRYALAGAAAPEEARLADAVIEVYDLEGRRLVGANGTPITARTDGKGGYQLQAPLPAEPLVLRVGLAAGVAGKREGELAALLLPGGAERETTLDTASTLGASYLIGKVTLGRAGVLARLPAAEAEALRREAEAARGLLPGAPSYAVDDMVAAAEGLRAKAPAFDATLKRIEAILLAGQEDLGDGQIATRVGLSTPYALAGDGQGGLWIGEVLPGRVRRVALGATEAALTVVVGETAEVGRVDALLRAPDGGFYIADSLLGRVWRVAPDGATTIVAGALTDGPLKTPTSLALGADGSLLIGEAPPRSPDVGRLLRLKADGTLEPIAYPANPAGTRQPKFRGVAEAADGTLYVYDDGANRITVRRPGGDWITFAADVSPHDYGRLAVGPAGELYASESNRHRIWRFAPDGTKSPVAGNGQVGHTDDGAPAAGGSLNTPAGMWVDADGTVYFAEGGSNLVRSIGPDGLMRTVAGTLASAAAGLATGVTINGPSGLAFDAAGRLTMAEATTGTLKRLEGDRLVAVGGTTAGFGGDGGPATNARFNAPISLLFVREPGGESLLVADALNNAIRRIGPDGVVTTIVRKAGSKDFDGSRSYPGLACPLGHPASLALGPDGLVYVADAKRNVVWRFRPGATVASVELVAGSAAGEPGDEGDGGPAAQAKLAKPSGLAIDREGRLFIADAANLRVRMIDLRDPQTPITTVAGAGIVEMVARFAGNLPMAPVAGSPAAEAALLTPTAVAIDAAGDLYIGESGTGHLAGVAGELSISLAALPPVPPAIWKVALGEPGRPIRRVAGPGSAVLAATEGPDHLGFVLGLAFDPEGRLIVADGARNVVRLVPREAL